MTKEMKMSEIREDGSFEAAMKVLILYHDHVLASKVNARLDRASTTFSE
jgi:hypothetical protein